MLTDETAPVIFEQLGDYWRKTGLIITNKLARENPLKTIVKRCEKLREVLNHKTVDGIIDPCANVDWTGSIGDATNKKNPLCSYRKMLSTCIEMLYHRAAGKDIRPIREHCFTRCIRCRHVMNGSCIDQIVLSVDFVFKHDGVWDDMVKLAKKGKWKAPK